MINAGIQPVAGEDLSGVCAQTSLKATTLAGAEIGADDVCESVGRGLLRVDFESVLEGLDEGKHTAAHFLDGAGEEELLLASNEWRIEASTDPDWEERGSERPANEYSNQEKTEKAVE